MLRLFSSDFVSQIWAKKPAELSVEFPFPISEQDVFETLLAYHERPDEIRKVNRYSEAVSAFNGVRLPRLNKDLVVHPTDASIGGYIDRLEALMGENEWGVAYFGLHAAHPALWDVAKQFSDTLAQSIGYHPGGRVDIDCFVGRYSSTHTGIHVDHAHNFSFTLRDGKTMFTWSGDRKDLQGMKYPEYERHKESSIALKNKSDRVAYFPHDSFHVAESKDNASININIAFWEAGNDLQVVTDYIHSLLLAPDRTSHEICNSGAATLNSEEKYLLSKLSQFTDGSIKRRLAIKKMIMATSGRLGVGRPLIEVIGVNDLVSLNSKSTLQWMQMDAKEEILIAANGHVASFPYSKSIEVFLDRLASNEIINVYQLLKESCFSSSNQLMQVLTALARWGAL